MGLFAADLSPADAALRNGIDVGRPKVFDNRSLVLMVEELDAQLRSVQAIESGSLVEALGGFQGYQSRERALRLNVSGPSIPGISTELTPDDQGDLGVSKRTIDQAAAAPAAPTPAFAAGGPSFEPELGIQSQDLLSEQVNLQYQVFNLRMLLERSLTDRIWNGQPRLQAILGFQISLDPPEQAKDAVATVEIRVAMKDGGQDPAARVSLVGLMPFQRTYNSAAVSTKSTDFGGAAVVKLITFGFGQKSQGKTLYVYQDVDTLSFERTAANDSGEVVFGWEFRPVLGRRSVAPGPRQVFAVLSLPQPDAPAEAKGEGDDAKDDLSHALRVTAATYWRRYDRRHATVAVGKWLNKEHVKPRTGIELDPALEVLDTDASQSGLRPEIRSIHWTQTGPRTAVVTVEGENFFKGTSVVLGDQVHAGPASGLLIKSDRSLEVSTSLAALATGQGLLNGRYGASLPLQASLPDRRLPDGIFLDGVRLDRPIGSRFHELTFEITRADGQAFTEKQVGLLPEPVLALNGEPIPGPYRMRLVEDRSRDKKGPEAAAENAGADLGGDKHDAKVEPHLEIQVWLDAARDPTNGPVSICFPFLGPRWAASGRVYDPMSDIRLLPLSSKTATKAVLLISGLVDPTGWKVELDQAYEITSPELKESGQDALRLTVDKTTASQYQRLVLRSPQGRTVLLDLAGTEVPKATPKPGLQQAAAVVTQNHNGFVTFTGVDLNAVTRVLFEGKELRTQALDKGTKLSVFITREITAKPGKVTLLLEWAGGAPLTATVTVNAA